jgi:DNA-binding transcriptional LysR family regulator
VELSDLILFKAVAETGGVTRAAQRVHRVQSNVTARIKKLESQLGVALFVRARRGMGLTPEGRRLLTYADRLLALAEEAQADVGGQPPRGRLRIGALESTAAVHLPRLLSTLHGKYPDLEVELVTGTSGVLLRQVRGGELSAAFVAGDIVDPGIAAHPAFVEELVLVTHGAARAAPAPEALRGRTLIAFGQGCAYRACIEGWLEARQIRPPRVFEVGSYHAMLACLAADMGYGLVPRSVLRSAEGRTSVRAHAVGTRPWHVTTWLVHRANDRSRAVQALRDLVLAAPPPAARPPGGPRPPRPPRGPQRPPAADGRSPMTSNFPGASTFSRFTTPSSTSIA